MFKQQFPERTPISQESGRASLEFLAAGLILFLPLLFLAITLWEIQRAQMATDAAARHAVRVYSQHTSLDQAERATASAIRLALGQWGIAQTPSVSLSCQTPGNCLAPGQAVSIRIVVAITVLEVPFIPVQLPIEVPISGEGQAIVSGYRGSP